MINPLKSIRYLLILYTIFSLSVATAGETPKRSIMLWGTLHREMSFETNNVCAEQYEIVAKSIRETPELIDSHLPHFIFGVESAAPHPRVLSMDDHAQKVYIGLYVHTGISLNKLRELLNGQNDPKLVEQYLIELLGNFYGFYFTENTHGDHVVTEIANKIITRDRNTEYFQRIKGDIDLIQSLNSVPIQSLGSGALQTIKTYAQSGRSPDPKQFKLILDSYLLLSKAIAQEYFNQKIKPASQKYNITLDYPGSQYDGKSAFTIAEPEVMFSENHMLGSFDETQKHFQTLVTITWRDHFIAKNIIATIKKNPIANILFWYGKNHMAGVVRNIMMSNQLTLDEKSAIQVVSQDTKPNIACDANKVLDSMVQKPWSDDVEIPDSLNEWYALHGLKDRKHEITVYTLAGKQVYTNADFSNVIAKNTVEYYIKKELKKMNLDQGAYFVQIRTLKNVNIEIFKILYTQ
jgi:hypothetical protein